MFENLKFKIDFGGGQKLSGVDVTTQKEKPSPNMHPTATLLSPYSNLYRAFIGETEKRDLFLATRGPKSLAQQPWVVEIVKSCADRHFARIEWDKMFEIYCKKRKDNDVGYRIGKVNYGDPVIFGLKHSRFVSLFEDAESFKSENRIQLVNSSEYRCLEQELDRYREVAENRKGATEELRRFRVYMDLYETTPSLSTYLARDAFCEVAPLLLKASLLMETLRELKVTLPTTIMTSIVLDGRGPWELLKSGRLIREIRVRLENNQSISKAETPSETSPDRIVIPKLPTLTRDEMRESLQTYFSSLPQPLSEPKQVIKSLLSLVTRGNITFSELCNRLEGGEHYLTVIQSIRQRGSEIASPEDAKVVLDSEDFGESPPQLEDLPRPSTSHDGLLKHPISVEFFTKNEKCPVFDWIDDLDNSLAEQVEQRLARLRDGNFGDCKQIRSGLYEARIHARPGLRVFFCKKDSETILILNGCKKDEQDEGIAKALAYMDS